MHAGSEWLLVKAGRLIDGTGAAAKSNAAVLARGDLIVEVGAAASVRAPDGARFIDAPNATIIPGLVDCHHHVTYSGHIGIGQLEWPLSLEYSAVCAGANAARALSYGYTSAMDVGCRGLIGVATRDAIEKGVINGPNLRVSGQILNTVGGPLDIWPSTMRFDSHTRLATFVSGVEDVRRTIREQLKEGVDNVKLQTTRSTVQPAGRGRAVTFTEEELAAAVGFAHDHGLSIAVHAEGSEGIQEAIRAGFDTVQHASFIDDECIDLLERHPTTHVVFTLGVYDGILELGPQIGYPLESIERVRAVWQQMLDGVRLAYARGVPFAAGSDCGGAVHPHGRYARDVVLFVRECGMSVEHALRAVTLYAATAGWFEGRGSLSPGHFADLAVVEGDLTKRIELLEDEASVRVVVRGGVVVKELTPSAIRTEAAPVSAS
ncbi:MAG TPA: amidohydrolase family protein [Candidatus Limnocylindria bacterium]|jgi:imidazolonepropionase-like amidohydrolase|nr:amidohydrolase family protein [Candidatus Limnocylindria bacterium]